MDKKQLLRIAYIYDCYKNISEAHVNDHYKFISIVYQERWSVESTTIELFVLL